LVKTKGNSISFEVQKIYVYIIGLTQDNHNWWSI